MTEKFKKIERQYVLSDSSVNEYGFRLLTSGYQLEAYQKNPIGYYMHKREDGIVLKWEDLRVEDDKIVGTPVINLSNGRGVQTCDEAENGFLNAASVGHIVVLEFSNEKELMLPGQTGPTITKWYNKECSLVDIPGNCNALTRLYDAQENELNLVDLNINQPIVKTLQLNVLNEIKEALNLNSKTEDGELGAAVKTIVGNVAKLELDNKALADEKNQLLEQLEVINKAKNKHEVGALLDRALEDKKITIELKDKLANDYENNPEGLKGLLGAMPAYRSITELLKNKNELKGEAQWLWDDYEKNDPSGKKLKELRANDPVRYQELFDGKFFS